MTMEINNTPPKPFIKWVGGKRQLLPELTKRLPPDIESYFEPFIGGGALLWSLNKANISRITINDYNHEISNLYTVVRDSPSSLIKKLATFKNTEKHFYKVRTMDRVKSYSRRSPITKAGRFIFINKTGFNGLYRVNSKGQNNVPYGRYHNPKILDEENLYACSSFLQDVEILNGDFETIKPLLTPGSFVYLDPPYMPLSQTSNFTGYTELGFNSDMQHRLKEFCDYITSLGAKFMMSNSASPLIYNLYQDYTIDEVLANRAVNCKASGRGKITELIIKNY